MQNTEDALQAYREQVENGKTINIITIDLDIFDFDGKECCMIIREFERENHLTPSTIIILSNHGNQGEIEEFLNPQKLGANHYRIKPVYLNDF